MNRKLISKAISNIDQAFILEAMSPPAVHVNTPERTATMKRTHTTKRRMLRLIFAACLIFALALSAYAFNFLGIRQMLQKNGQELPEAADPY